jgi:hypothetical protein
MECLTYTIKYKQTNMLMCNCKWGQLELVDLFLIVYIISPISMGSSFVILEVDVYGLKYNLDKLIFVDIIISYKKNERTIV